MIERMTRRALVLGAAATLAAPGAPRAGATPVAIRAARDFLDRLGVCVHLHHTTGPYADRFSSHVVPMVQDLGIKRLRDDAIMFPTTRRTHHQYRRIRELAKLGVRFNLICNDPIAVWHPFPPERVRDLYAWCDGAIDVIEGSNEPRLFLDPANPGISAAHQRALYRTVKDDPTLAHLTVAGPSYIATSAALAPDLRDALDVANLHPYPGMEHPETRGPGSLDRALEEFRHVAGDKPFIVTETGYHTALETKSGHLPVSEAIKARYLPRLLLRTYLRGAEQTFVYELISSLPTQPAEKESLFGLAHHDGTLTPSYTALRALIGLLTGNRTPDGGRPAPRITLAADPDLHQVAFARADGTTVLLLWLGVSGWNARTRTGLPARSRTVRFDVSPAAVDVVAHVFRDDGSLERVAPGRTGDGSFAVAVSDQLLAVEIG